MGIDERILALVAAGCLTVYWGAVLVKLVKLARKIGKDPNALPRERVGQLMRVVWYPAVIAQLTIAWLAATGGDRRLGGHLGLEFWLERIWPVNLAWCVAAGVAAAVCVAGTVYTFVCWRRMGRSWRIGIDPKETLELVSSGPYRYVRHPIYAIRMVIDACAWVLVPSVAMAVLAGVDIVLMQVEARREERYMEQTHGAAYGAYKKNVGRFVPRLLVG